MLFCDSSELDPDHEISDMPGIAAGILYLHFLYAAKLDSVGLIKKKVYAYRL
jgi:hypothetical protein